MLGKTITVRVPKSYKYSERHQGKTYEGKVVKVNRKSYVVRVYPDDNSMLEVLTRRSKNETNKNGSSA